MAERKITGLLACQAAVTVVAPAVTPAIAALAAAGDLEWAERPYQAGEAADYRLVVTATGVATVDQQAAADAEQAGRLVNAASGQAVGNLIVPALVRRGPLTFAISTGGAAPAVARRIRRELEQAFGAEYETFVQRVAQVRQALAHTVSEEQMRTQILQALAASELPQLYREGRQEAAEQVVARIIARIMGGEL